MARSGSAEKAGAKARKGTKTGAAKKKAAGKKPLKGAAAAGGSAIGDAAKAAATRNEERFRRCYLSSVPPRDLEVLTADVLQEATAALWKAGRKRKPGKPVVTVSNPPAPRSKKKKPNRQHTVVEIINDDMPFLVDSVTSELNGQSLTVHLVCHPILRLRRDKNGRVTDVLEGESIDAGVLTESWMRVEIDQVTDPDKLNEIRDGVLRVLSDVRAAVEDWQAILGRVHTMVSDLTISPPAIDPEDVQEVRSFLTWLTEDNFTFLGYREYKIVGSGRNAKMAVDPKSGLGLLRDQDFHVFEGMHDMAKLPPDVRAFIEKPDLLIINKANVRSTVHRRVHLDAIGVKLFDANGKVTGERLMVGLFTSTVYSRSPRSMPLVRRKIEQVLHRSGMLPNSHDGKALTHILVNYPRDELFQISTDDLARISLGILHLQDRQRIALFVRHDPFHRFVSCLVYVPRDRYTTDMRKKFGKILEEDFAGEVTAYYTQLGDDAELARVHFIIKTDATAAQYTEFAETEARLTEAARSWADRLRDELVEAHGEEAGLSLLHKYADAFGVGYRDDRSAATAIEDIELIEDVLKTGHLGMNLYRPGHESTDGGAAFRFCVYHLAAPVALSDVLPMLENFGLKVIDELPYPAHPRNGTPVYMHDFGLRENSRMGDDADPISRRDTFHEAFAKVWDGETEDDRFNALVLAAGLNWREVVVIRAYARYLRQAGVPFSLDYLAQTLIGNATITRDIVDLFLDRVDPKRQKKGRSRAAEIAARIEKALEDVSNLDEDRILRRFVNLVDCTLRCNFHQEAEGGGPKPYLSMKLDSQRLAELPLPRPMVEIWVYSPRVEGVHLRFGKVARGGLRWSDRREDFRTEILGLVKAQKVKNAVIVPVGSKGGFVVKKPPANPSREAQQDEGIACYKTFIRGMLDLTDNIRGDRIAPPPDVVRHDGDDPYLVVAADKGTATFSDIANGVSEEYGFWLGDAFASGGSAGYDHKAMGITARGAWEAVKRHFRELGKDIQSEDFTAVGIGDMSGDVFGNGMLLSPHIRLVAAFNHMHIFIDPDPDPEKSWAERKRLFDLPRSSWTDYDSKLISKGGGVFERSAKSIQLSPEIKSLLGVDKDSLPPSELLRSILKANVDLLWFGGIGTYVKAHAEANADAGDRANDAIRVNGRDLGAKVVGEGANLGMTQLGRIEYALAGGRLNTDAIDNSAGVDCSDHEVNIKILLGDAIARGRLAPKKRNALLADMTDEVAELVLRDNYLQTAALSVTEQLGAKGLDRQTRLIRALERSGLLDRQVEFLPDEETLEDRSMRGVGLTRPELSVLLAYAKIELFEALVASDVTGDKQLELDLYRYFPQPLQKKYRMEIDNHRLRPEIIATHLTNSLVNRAGITFAHDLHGETGLPFADIARSYIMTRDAFDLRDLWEAVEALDNRIPAAAQYDILLSTGKFVKRACRWFLRNAERPLDIRATVDAYRPGLTAFGDGCEKMLTEVGAARLKKRIQRFEGEGLSPELARKVAMQPLLLSAADIARLARGRDADIGKIGRLYFIAGEQLGFDWLREGALAISPGDYWDKMAISAIVDDLYAHQYDLATRMLEEGGRRPIPDRFQAWADSHAGAIAQTERMLDELRTGVSQPDIAMLAVANRQLRALADA